MAWSTSRPFRALLTDYLSGTITWDLNAPSDSILAAWYDNDITPDADASSADSAYNAGQWATSGNEVSDAGGWAAGGRALDSVAVSNPSSLVVRLDAADEVSGTLSTGLTNYTGLLVYNGTAASPVADQGICFNYLGSAQTTGAGGTVTVVFHANGLFQITIT